jgi:hypothetical protein
LFLSPDVLISYWTSSSPNSLRCFSLLFTTINLMRRIKQLTCYELFLLWCFCPNVN